MEFFRTSTGNLLSYEAKAGVRHHVALSMVGIPYSIVHATQFFEFWQGIADGATDGNKVRVPPVFIQPIAADDVAASVAKVAIGKPLNGVAEVAGPKRFHFDEFIRKGLLARNDARSGRRSKCAIL